MALKSYRFKDKDHVIDILRTAIQLEADAKGVSFNQTLHVLADESGVSYSCMSNWFYGSTISPIHKNVAAVALCLRWRWKIGDKELPQRVTHNVVKLRRVA